MQIEIKITILMWNIKALRLALTVQQLLARLKFLKIGQTPRSQGTKWWYTHRKVLSQLRNTHVKYHRSSFDSDRITKWQDKNNMPPTPPPQIFDLGGLKIPICTFSSSKNVIENTWTGMKWAQTPEAHRPQWSSEYQRLYTDS